MLAPRSALGEEVWLGSLDDLDHGRVSIVPSDWRTILRQHRFHGRRRGGVCEAGPFMA